MAKRTTSTKKKTRTVAAAKSSRTAAKPAKAKSAATKTSKKTAKKKAKVTKKTTARPTAKSKVTKPAKPASSAKGKKTAKASRSAGKTSKSAPKAKAPKTAAPPPPPPVEPPAPEPQVQQPAPPPAEKPKPPTTHRAPSKRAKPPAPKMPKLGEPLFRPGAPAPKPLIASGPKAAPASLPTQHGGGTPVKSPLDRKQLEQFRQILLAKRLELVGDVATMENEALMSQSGALSHLPQHMAEQGSDVYGQSLSLDLAAADRRLIKEIDDALIRIQQGTYGVCELTGKPIKLERLQELPWARYSIEAARELERRGATQ